MRSGAVFDKKPTLRTQRFPTVVPRSPVPHLLHPNTDLFHETVALEHGSARPTALDVVLYVALHTVPGAVD